MKRIELKKVKPKTWNNYWSREKYPPISKTFELTKRGKPVLSKMCMAAFSDAMGDHYREGMSVLDYGCGNGRYANFLARRLGSFQYFGVEPHEFAPNFAEDWHYFKPHSHIRLGSIGDTVEATALREAGVILLLSVLTHLPHDELLSLIPKFEPVFQRGGIMVFSVFIDRENSLGRKKEQLGECPSIGYYHEVFWKPVTLKKLFAQFNLALERRGSWDAGRVPHMIYAAGCRESL